MKRLAIVQSSYIPWKGYFDLIRAADEFVLLDDVQYTKRDWRNRNRIKTAQGVQWLSIPVSVAGRFEQTIAEVAIQDASWAHRHWRTIARSYARAPAFAEYAAGMEALYERAAGERRLSVVNRLFLEGICRMLEIDTPMTWSAEYEPAGTRTGRLVDICRKAGAAEYLSGPSAQAYIDPALFDAAGIKLTFVDYTPYPEYPQLHPPFEHRVSAVDLVLTHGRAAAAYLLRF